MQSTAKKIEASERPVNVLKLNRFFKKIFSFISRVTGTSMRFLKYISILFIVFSVSACGGGGDSASDCMPGWFNCTVQGGGGGQTATSGNLTLSIVDSSGVVTNNITFGGGFIARAVLQDANGSPISNKLVTFSSQDDALATIDPLTALTNATGVAEATISPASTTVRGAGVISVAADFDGAPSVSARKEFAFSPLGLGLSTITVGSPNLPAGGNTNLSVTALLGGNPSTTIPVNIALTASCGRINGQDATVAGGVSVTTAGSGTATADYQATRVDGSLCSGAVTVSASSPGVSTPQTATINVAAPTASSITFASSSPEQIFLSGTGATDRALVRFRVLSALNTPLQGETVNFSLDTNPGGVIIESTSGVTDIDGFVQVNLRAGSVPGPVRVRAQMAGNAAIFALSQNLSVASGPPSQRFMSLSVETFNIEGWNIDGTPTSLTVRLADRQGNAVQDGTVVNFTTEGGQVASSCATVRENNISSCSVNFVSQNFRPANGRVSVLAYTEGTKDYEDLNFNNRYDAGVDTLIDIGDAYRDDNESGIWEPGEFVIPRGGSQACAGTGGTFPGRADSCDGLLATTVRQQTVIMFSASNSTITNIVSNSLNAVSFRVGSVHNTNLPMPAGTTVAAEVVSAPRAPGVTECAIGAGPTNSTIGNIGSGTNPNANLSTQHEVLLTDCINGDRLVISTTTPAGIVSSSVLTAVGGVFQ